MQMKSRAVLEDRKHESLQKTDPSKMLPISPMKTFALGMFRGRKPRAGKRNTYSYGGKQGLPIMEENINGEQTKSNGSSDPRDAIDPIHEVVKVGCPDNEDRPKQHPWQKP